MNRLIKKADDNLRQEIIDKCNNYIPMLNQAIGDWVPKIEFDESQLKFWAYAITKTIPSGYDFPINDKLKGIIESVITEEIHYGDFSFWLVESENI